MKNYVVTGFDKKKGKMATRKFTSIEHVVELINMCADGTSSLGESVVKSAKDLDFDVQTRANHGSAVIVDDQNYCWSIFLIK